jgi:WD40 repeat protein/tetratricopeptide (TPR) repeat protein
MGILATCPGCKINLTLNDDRGGTMMNCPTCAASIKVPDLALSPAPTSFPIPLSLDNNCPSPRPLKNRLLRKGTAVGFCLLLLVGLLVLVWTLFPNKTPNTNLVELTTGHKEEPKIEPQSQDPDGKEEFEIAPNPHQPNSAVTVRSDDVPSNPKDAKGFVERGIAFCEKKEYDKAIADYTEAIKREPKLADAFGHRAHAYEAKGDDDRAIADCTAALKLDPKLFIAYHTRGLSYVHTKYFENAIEDLTAAIQLDPKSSQSFLGRGNAYAAKEDYEQAIKDYSEAIRLDPKYHVAFYSRGIAFNNKKGYDKAINDFNVAIQLNPKSFTSFYGRGNAYAGKNNYNQAIKDYTEAINLDPKSAIAYRKRSDAYSKQGKLVQSKADLQEAQRLEADRSAVATESQPQPTQDKKQDQKKLQAAKAHYEQGLRYFRDKMYDKAILEFTEAIRLDPDNSIYPKNRGIVYRTKGAMDQAITDFSEAIRLSPDYREAFVERGSAYATKKDFDRAIVDYTKAIGEYTKVIATLPWSLADRTARAAVFVERGNAYADKKDFDRAIADYTKAIESMPTNFLVYEMRSKAYASKGDVDQAQADQQEAKRLNALKDSKTAPRNTTSSKTPVSETQKAKPPTPVSKDLVILKGEKPIEVRRFEGHNNIVTTVAFFSDGNRMLSGSADKTIRLWDTGTGKEIRRFTEDMDRINSLAISPDGRQFLCGCKDGTVRLWDIERGTEVRQFNGHTKVVLSVAFSSDGHQAISGGHDGTIRLWEIATGKEIRRFEGHTSYVHCVKFSPDGNRVVSAGGDDKTVRLWDVTTGRELPRLAKCDLGFTCVAFSPDGHSILAGGCVLDSNSQTITGTIVMWDAESGRLVRSFDKNNGYIFCLACTPSGRQVISGSAVELKDGKSRPGVVRLWDVERGQELCVLESHRGGIFSVAISQDGRQAVSGGGMENDCSIRLWQLPPEQKRTGPNTGTLVTRDTTKSSDKDKSTRSKTEQIPDEVKKDEHKNAEDRLPDVPGYDFKVGQEETLSVKATKQSTGGTYYIAEFTQKKGESRRYLIETFPTGKPFSIEVFRNNQPAEGKAWWSNGQQSLSTSFRNFSPSGTWEFWNNKGEIIGKVEFGAGKPKLLTWDKEQMATLAKTNNFYNDIVSALVEELRK